MSKNIIIEIDSKYREHLDLLKDIFPSNDSGEITSDSEIVGALIESFMAFIQEQAQAHEHDSCGNGGCSHSH
ncbi:MAG: hypothetical protein PHH06_03470 [Candidatus Gracilibacteria bacterium]|nr:hypothetical protein [Candidatus Gracilibacteria bacterium]